MTLVIQTDAPPPTQPFVFQADGTHSVETSLTIRGEATDNAVTFVGGSGNTSSRGTTTASVSWSPAPWTTQGEAGPDQLTPNNAAIVQEIVSRSGWSSGNSLGIIITGTGERAVEAHEACRLRRLCCTQSIPCSRA